MVLEDDHNGEYLASMLQDTICEWDLEGKVHVAVRDNGANIVRAMRIAEITDMSCAAHTIQRRTVHSDVS